MHVSSDWEYSHKPRKLIAQIFDKKHNVCLLRFEQAKIHTGINKTLGESTKHLKTKGWSFPLCNILHIYFLFCVCVVIICTDLTTTKDSIEMTKSSIFHSAVLISM